MRYVTMCLLAGVLVNCWSGQGTLQLEEDVPEEVDCEEQLLVQQDIIDQLVEDLQKCSEQLGDCEENVEELEAELEEKCKKHRKHRRGGHHGHHRHHDDD